MKTYIAVPHNMPKSLTSKLERWKAIHGSENIAHMVYRIRGTRLYLARDTKNVHSGIMVVGIASYTGGGPTEPLLDDIAAEIKKREFSGILLDTGGVSTTTQTALAGRIVSAFRPYPVYVPEKLASVVSDSIPLIQTALSGGSLERHLQQAADTFGGENIAIECDRIVMDFTLPATDGIGESMDPSSLEEMFSQKDRKVFFSQELCVNYFTYTSDGERHFVLFDNAESLNRKFQIAEEYGVSQAFIYYPHVHDIIDDII